LPSGNGKPTEGGKRKSEKGNPPEKGGRKITGLTGASLMTAGLPDSLFRGRAFLLFSRKTAIPRLRAKHSPLFEDLQNESSRNFLAE
jgi:hypothetical protein